MCHLLQAVQNQQKFTSKFNNNQNQIKIPMKRLISTFSFALGLCVIFASTSFGQVNCRMNIIANPSPTNPFTFTFYAVPADSLSIQCFNANTTYTWSFGNGQTSTQANPSYTYLTSGSYSICVQARFQGAVYTECDTLNVGIPNCSLTYSVQPGLPAIPLTFEFNPIPSSSSCFISYEWKWGDGTTSVDSLPARKIKTYLTPGIYNVCLVGYRQVGSPVEYCQMLNATGTTNVNVMGLVQADGECYDGQTLVELISLNGPEIYRDTVSRSLDSCFYNFSVPPHLQPRVWTVRATPLQTDEYVATYLGDVLFSEDATLFTTPTQNQLLPTINLLGNFFDSLVAGNPNPQGIISGNISGNGIQVSAFVQGYNLNTTFNVSQARVIAMDANGNAVAIAMVQADGSYAFPALPAGNYSVRVEYPGIPSQPIPVQISASGATLNFATSSSGVSIVTSNRLKFNKVQSTLYPNPATNLINVSGFDGKVKILNVTGKVLIECMTDAPINVEILPSGLYTLVGQSSDFKTQIMRFTKK